MRYRFKNTYRQFRPGDPVPDTFPPGVVDALVQAQRVEAVPAPAPAKSIDAPPADKLFRAGKGSKRKGEA